MRTPISVFLLVVPHVAWGHGGLPAIADILVAPGRCVVVKDSARIAWRDSDQDTIFGPAGVEIYTSTVPSRPLYTNEEPFVPRTLVHRAIESDPTNQFVWRTSTVSEGHYFVFSYVREPPEELSPVIVRYAPYVITVQRGAEPIGPTVVVTRPDVFAGSLGMTRIHYSACDPTGTARVRLEVAREPGDGPYQIIFDDLPAVPTATVTWDTRPFEFGRWVVRATISDECGHVFQSYARGFLEVRDPIDPFDAGGDDARVAEPIDARTGGGAACLGFPDASPALDQGVADAGIVGAPDAASGPDAGEPPGDEGCGCSTPGEKPANLWWMLALALALPRLRRASAVIALSLVPFAARAQTPPPDPARPPEGEVRTYYGLRQMEFDANISDEEKAREWENFLKRNVEQVAYAKQAVLRWKDAGRVRAVESAQQLDAMPEAPANEKIEAWQKVIAQFPKSPDARTAEKRIAALQAQLFKEAEDLDRIPRVDVETKLAAWRDVMSGMPNAAQKRTAEQRIAYLQSKARP